MPSNGPKNTPSLRTHRLLKVNDDHDGEHARLWTPVTSWRSLEVVRYETDVFEFVQVQAAPVFTGADWPEAGAAAAGVLVEQSVFPPSLGVSQDVGRKLATMPFVVSLNRAALLYGLLDEAKRSRVQGYLPFCGTLPQPSCQTDGFNPLSGRACRISVLPLGVPVVWPDNEATGRPSCSSPPTPPVVPTPPNRLRA